MKRKNLLLATIVALSMSATSVIAPLSALNLGTQTVYAGVVKRNVTSKSSQTTSAATTNASSDANTNQQETSIGTAASSDGKTHTEVDSNGQTVKQQDLQDGASKYAICTFQGKPYSSDFHPVSGGYIEDGHRLVDPLINPDGSPRKMKEPVIYPIEVYKTSDWLFPNGVAKTPGYLSAELEVETASFDDRTTVKFEPTLEGYPHYTPSMLYRTKTTTEDRLWPEVNPITGRPLWDTQPFWRSDNSFDLYGYLKQFTPEYKNRKMRITADGLANWKKFGNKTMYSSVIDLSHDLVKTDETDCGDGATGLSISLANSGPSDEHTNGIYNIVTFNYTFRMPDGTWKNNRASAVLKHGYEGQKIRITGTKDAYINETVLKTVETIMHYFIDDHTFGNVIKHGDVIEVIPVPGFDEKNANILFEADE